MSKKKVTKNTTTVTNYHFQFDYLKNGQMDNESGRWVQNNKTVTEVVTEEDVDNA